MYVIVHDAVVAEWNKTSQVIIETFFPYLTTAVDPT